MTLVDQCEDLFAYLCLLNHLGRQYERDPSIIRDKAPTPEEARKQIMQHLRDIKEAADPQVFNRNVEIALWATADWMVSECRLPWAAAWDKRGFDPGGVREQTLDALFWDCMGATLGEVENEANEQRLAVFASCISLGFLGMHMDPSKPLDTPDTVRTEMRRIWTRVKGKYEREKNGRVTQQAYEHNDERDLTPDPVHGTLGWVVVLVAFIVGLIVVQVVMYRTASSKIQASLDSLAKQQVAAQPPAKPEGSK